jgi:hypothetical protein
MRQLQHNLQVSDDLAKLFETRKTDVEITNG